MASATAASKAEGRARHTVRSVSSISAGRMWKGFEIQPAAGQSRLRVFIDYDLPPELPSRWLGRALGRVYARWCTEQMVKDAATQFPKSASDHPQVAES